MPPRHGAGTGSTRQQIYPAQPLGVWAADILANIGAPHSQNNVSNLAAWWSCESARSGFGDTLRAGYNNIFNTEQFQHGPKLPGYGVNTYGNYNTGLWATLMTLRMSAFSGIVEALRADASRQEFAAAVGASGWGTSASCIASSTATAGLLAGTGLRPAGPVGGYGQGGAPATTALAAGGCKRTLLLMPALLTVAIFRKMLGH
jgi:hypothetical protein